MGFFFTVFLWKMYADLFKGSVNLSVRFGFFRGILGECFCAFGFFFFSCWFWQPRGNAGFLQDRDGPTAESGPVLRQRSAFPLRARRTLREYPLFRADFAELLSEPPRAVAGSRQQWGLSRRRDGHPGFEQPIFVWSVP